jgi:hypothetical protein
MMHRACAAAVCAALFVASGVRSDTAAQSATASRTRSHVTALASEQLEGRLAGSNGERLAADYLVAQLKRIGARPLPGAQDFRLPFEFTAGTRDGGSNLSLTCTEKEKGGTAARCGSTFGAGAISALSFSDDREVSGAAVFAGYGIVVPDGQDFGYDSYAGLDVKTRSSSSFATSRRMPTPRRKACSRVMPISATRRWPPDSAARERSSSSPVRARRTRESSSRWRSTPRSPGRASSPPA